MDTTEITHLSLCSGYGGIDLGLKGVFGENVRTLAYAEIEAFAIECLLARMEGGQLDAAPIWPNIKSFPWGAFSDRVDILSGGYPCQPFSAAGKRLGTEDPRHLWPFIADGIRIMRPKLCFFENVEGHISLGLREVIEELGSIGYKTTWGIFSASEVGAPHQRKRVFIMAHRKEQRLERYRGLEPSGIRNDAWPSRPSQPQHEWEPPRVVQTGLANSKSVRHSGFQAKCGSVAQRGVQKVAESNQEHTSEPIGLSSVVEPPRVVGNANSWRQSPSIDTGSSGETISGGESNIEQTECRQAEPALGGNTHGAARGLDYAELSVTCDNRTDELRLLGNGVVPATATRAFLTLLKELNE